jgi:undecaprenyl pyrophosphate synthase
VPKELNCITCVAHFPVRLQAAVVPFEAKTHAVAYISNNCSVSSGRNDIMRALLAVAAKSAAGGSKLQIHSMGKCENNKAWPEKQSQQQVMSR